MAEIDGLSDDSGEGLTDLYSCGQLSEATVERLFELADQMRSLVDNCGGCDRLRHRVLAAVFYEPSTRTASSFVAAMQRLGGEVIPLLQGAEATSAAKGESLRDTARVMSGYADLIVLRHPERGSAKRAAEVASVPVVNAGDGTGEHPTQALLDRYTMQDKLGDLDDKLVTIAGDLKFGRTVHSLARLLVGSGAAVQFVSPPSLRLPDVLLDELDASGLTYEECETLDPVLNQTDVLYMTRIQQERFDDPAEYDRLAGTYQVDRGTMDRLPDEALLMHPLPRVGEIGPEIDDDSRAIYFEQAENGMYVRMALLAELLDR